MKIRGETLKATNENCRAGLTLAGDLASTDDFTDALRLLQILKAAAPEASVAAEIQASTTEIESSRAALGRIAPSIQKLKTSPDDPSANLAVGQYLCFTKNDWNAGLPHLAKASKSGMSSAAALDLAGPSNPEQQIAAGDAWWSLAEKEKGAVQTGAEQRAAYWYNLAVAGGTISGLQLVLINKRIATASASRSTMALSRGRRPHITVIRADYGDGTRLLSVVKTIQDELDADPFVPVHVGSWWGKDPAPYVRKTLTLTYRIDGENHTVTGGEDEVFLVPPVPAEGMEIAGASVPFKIVAARYGVDNQWIDVTDQIRNQISDPSQQVKAHNYAGKDLHPGIHKHLVVYFEIKGRRYARIASDEGSIPLMPK
jgi:hypothetical protein